MKTYPIFRLTIALVAGILFTNTYRTEITYWSIGALLFLLLALGGLLKYHSFAGRWVFGMGVSFFMFLVGCVLTGQAWRKVMVDWPEEVRAYRGVVIGTPVEKMKTYQCRVKIQNIEVLLYLPKDSLSASIRIGDGLFFNAKMDVPHNKGDNSFDYATFLLHHGVSGTIYVTADAWRKYERDSRSGWRLMALSFRERIIEKFRKWGIGKEQLPVLSALTLGYKGDLDTETRERYSAAGISHVLALSGMHIGILWILLDGLLQPLMIRRLKMLKWLLVSITLWAFAFIVGCEPSVVRAVLMCMIMELGILSGIRPLSMNTLFVAAFFMLLYRPFYLFDVGFQLSFVAVASILVFYPMFNGLISCRYRIGRSVWAAISVSMAAQLGTAPLVMYYFSNFSVYFLLANLVAALLVPLIIYGTFVMVLLAPFLTVQWWLVSALNEMVACLNGVAEWTSGLPYAKLSVSVLHPGEIVLCYLMIILGVLYWKTKRRKWLIGTLFVCVCLLGMHLCLLLFETTK